MKASIWIICKLLCIWCNNDVPLVCISIFKKKRKKEHKIQMCVFETLFVIYGILNNKNKHYYGELFMFMCKVWMMVVCLKNKHLNQNIHTILLATYYLYYGFIDAMQLAYSQLAVHKHTHTRCACTFNSRFTRKKCCCRYENVPEYRVPQNENQLDLASFFACI